MPHFGSASKDTLLECHPKLQKICNEVIKMYDFTVLEGHRSQIEQSKLFREGKSKAQYPHSKHNYFPSLAVDIAPYPIDWEDTSRFYFLAGLMFAEAHRQGVKIRWGGDWNGNFNFKDQTWFDLPHFELIG